VRNVFALVFAAVGIGGAIVMFTLKTGHKYGGFGSAAPATYGHPAWATAVGIGFLIVGLALAAATMLSGKQSTAS
jgi:hypothetical protein